MLDERKSQARARWHRHGQLSLSLMLIATMTMLALGCENTTPTPELSAELEKITTAYLHDLADAYSSMDVSMLSRHASRREIDEVRKLLDKLSMSGDRLQATLLHVDVQDIEVWDVGRYDAYNGREKARNPSSVQRSIIQLRRIDGVWKVIGRLVMETQGGSKWHFDDEDEAGETPGETPGETATEHPAPNAEDAEDTAAESPKTDDPRDTAQPEPEAARDTATEEPG